MASESTAFVFNRVKYGAFGEAFKDIILATIAYALAGVNILGVKPFQWMQAWADALVQDAADALQSAADAQAQAATANAGVASNAAATQQSGGQSIFSTSDSTADVSVPAGVTSSGVATVDSTHAYWGFIRAHEPSQKASFTWIAKKSGTVSALYFDVYRLETDGSATLLYSSDDQSGQLSVADSWGGLVLPTPIVVQRDDVLGIQARMGGAGSVLFTGRTVSTPNAPNRPFQNGLLRNPSSSAAPSTIATATMDAAYSTTIPFMQFGAATNFSALPRTIADNFGNDLSQWVLTHSGTSSNLTISSGRLAFNGTTDGRQAGVMQMQLATDDWNVAAYLNNVSARKSYMIVAADATISNFLALGVDDSGCTFQRFSGGIGGSVTSVASSGTYGSGVWTVAYRSAANTFYAWNKNAPTIGVDTPLLTWADTSNTIPHTGGRRYFGLAHSRSFYVNSGDWDNFVAKDVTP